MQFNPFSKEIDVNKLYKTQDFNEAITRLNFLHDTQGFGLFTGFSGTGKTFTVNYYLNTLSSSLHKVIYLPLSSVTVMDFFRSMCIALNLETKTSKSKMFYDIQDTIKRLVKDQKKHLIIVIDEAQLLKQEILADLKILFNFDMDSKNMATVILMGLPILNHTLSKGINEELKQRIVMNYEFSGLSKEDIKGYISDRLHLVGAKPDIFTENVYEALPNLINGSIRKLNVLLTRALTLGAIEKVDFLDENLIMKATNDINLI